MSANTQTAEPIRTVSEALQSTDKRTFVLPDALTRATNMEVRRSLYESAPQPVKVAMLGDNTNNANYRALDYEPASTKFSTFLRTAWNYDVGTLEWPSGMDDQKITAALYKHFEGKPVEGYENLPPKFKSNNLGKPQMTPNGSLVLGFGIRTELVFELDKTTTIPRGPNRGKNPIVVTLRPKEEKVSPNGRPQIPCDVKATREAMKNLRADMPMVDITPTLEANNLTRTYVTFLQALLNQNNDPLSNVYWEKLTDADLHNYFSEARRTRNALCYVQNTRIPTALQNALMNHTDVIALPKQAGQGYNDRCILTVMPTQNGEFLFTLERNDDRFL